MKVQSPRERCDSPDNVFHSCHIYMPTRKSFASVLLLVTTTHAFVPTYFSDPDNLPYTNWLSYFAEFRVADLPVVPGSHNSATVKVSPGEDWLGIAGWLYAQTQTVSIYGQLLLGIRLVDLRLDVIFDEFDRNDSISISHTFDTNYTFSQSLAEIKLFLQANPTEFVYILLRTDAAFPLSEEIAAKQEYIQEVFLAADLPLASVNGTTLKTVKVKEVAGKVILITPPETLPNGTSLVYIPHPTNYDICDIYEYSSEYLAKNRMAQCFPIIPTAFTHQTGDLNGFALDGQFNQLWPNLTSPVMNDWWFYNLQTNPLWQERQMYPLGIFLFDFVNQTYMSTLLDFAMNFAYPYPRKRSPEPWTPGRNITNGSGGRHPLFVCSILAILISCS